MGDDLFLTVEEAAQRLNLNPETIRRRIRKGALKAQLMPGPRGDQYMIPANELLPEGQIVVPSFPITADQLNNLISKTVEAQKIELQQVVEAVVATKTEPMHEEIRQLRAELNAHNRRIDEQLRAALDKKEGFFHKLLKKFKS